MTDNAIDIGLRQSMQDQTKKKVLWENASPGSSFPTQKITIQGVGEYDELEVHHKPLTSSVTRKAEITPADSDAGGTLVNFLNLGSNSTSTTAYRPYTVENDGIDFSECESKAGVSGNVNIANTYNIPLAIYGIKVVGGVIHKLKTLAASLFTRREVAA